MAIATILTVGKKDLSTLTPERGVLFFREILWAEAGVSGIPNSCLSVPGEIFEADGGIDAAVKDSPSDSKQGVIKAGLTAYQIKTGKSDLNKQTILKDILFKEKSDELKPEVKNCLDNGGTLSIVHFGWDGPKVKVNKAIAAIKKFLVAVDKSYKKSRIAITSQNQVIGLLSLYPSLALRVNGKAEARFSTHLGWSSEAEMKRLFIPAPDQSAKMVTMQAELRRTDQPVHLHIVGEPGVGKTRLALEATKEDDLRPLIIYCDGPDKILMSQLMSILTHDDSSFYAILVVDECDDETRTKLWNKLQHHSPRIKLVTIYNEWGDVSQITYIESALLGKDQTGAIIETYGVPALEANRWAEFCGGSPRVAHVVGENLKNNPTDILKSSSTVDVWNRFIAGGDALGSEKVEERRLALQYLALFKKFGFLPPVQDEARAIAKLIEQANPRITWARFHQIVNELKKRKILQGSTTLYITPKLLHIKLWVDWWTNYGTAFEIGEFGSAFQPKLMDWFLEMFEYARESAEAFRRVRELLGPDGPFHGIESFKSTRGAFFFRKLALASPDEGLRCLERTIETCTIEQLLDFKEGRREVVWSLEHMALYRELFQSAARLLLKLAEAENETWGNNASGVFRDLFALGPGRVAPTSAPPEERLPVLSEALESGSPEARKLALVACEKALEATHFSKFGGFDEAGLRRGPEGWTPKTNTEWLEAYSQIWQLLLEQLDSLNSHDRQFAVNILLNRSRGLICRTGLGSMVIESLQILLIKGYASKKAVLKEVIEVVHYDLKQLPPDMKTKLDELKHKLEGGDFSSQLKRYVGMDLLEDKFDEEGHEADLGEKRIKELAQEAARDKTLLSSELDWLVTSEAENGLKFGYELGLAEDNFELLPVLVQAHRNATEETNVYFLSGYFRALSERNRPKWEEELDKVAGDSKLQACAPELTWRSGPLTDRAGERVLSLIQQQIVGFKHFRMFAYGSVTRDLSEGIFRKWIELLIQRNSRTATSIALDLSEFFYCRQDSRYLLPEDLGLSLLTHPSLFTPSQNDTETMRDYNWSRMGQRFVRKYPGRSLVLAKVMLEHFGQAGTIVEDKYGSTIDVLNEIVEKFPEVTWDEIKKYLGPPIDSRAFHLTHWLRGDEFSRGKGSKGGILPLVPISKLWVWVDENVKERAWYLTSMVPKTLFRDQDRICLAREVLVRYGNRTDVRNELMANFSTEGWRGSESSHLQGKKDDLLEFKAGESNKHVQRWIDEYIALINKEIVGAQIREEREEF